MSTFCGLMKEYRLVSLDRFDGINLESTVYMLSHCHSDHTVGLNSSQFYYRLQSNDMIKLYCSQITRDLLVLDERYKPLSSSIVALDVNCPQLIDIPDKCLGKIKEQVMVTLLHAGHCPGSVMFLLEGNEGTVLYTGDFRLLRQDFVDFEHLKSGSKVKAIETVYIDTTFCVPQAMFIPSREETTSAAVNLIRDWLSQSHGRHIVHLQYRADLGYENLFIRFSLEFNMKVHVDEERYERYSKLGDMLDFVTTDGSKTQLHACRQPCRHLRDAARQSLVRTLLFSTMCFLHRVSLDVYTLCISDTFYRVCYSFHSSYSEIRDALFYLKPKHAHPNVIPRYEENVSANRMQQRLDEFVRLAQLCHDPSASLTYRQLGQLKQPKSLRRKRHGNRRTGLKLLFGDADSQQNSPTSKRLKLATDSIDCLADLQEQTMKSSAISSSEDTTPRKFRLLFGDSSEDLSQQLSPRDEEHGNVDDSVESGVTSDSPSESGSNSDALRSDSEKGQDEVMTQADEEELRAYVSSNAGPLSYISDDDDGGNVLDFFLKPVTTRLGTGNCQTHLRRSTLDSVAVVGTVENDTVHKVAKSSSTSVTNGHCENNERESVVLSMLIHEPNTHDNIDRHLTDTATVCITEKSTMLNEDSDCSVNKALEVTALAVGLKDERTTAANGTEDIHLAVCHSRSQGSDEFRTPASQTSAHPSVVVVEDMTSRSAGSQPIDSDSTIDIGLSPIKNHLCSTVAASDATTTDGWCTPCKSCVPDVSGSQSPPHQHSNIGQLQMFSDRPKTSPRSPCSKLSNITSQPCVSEAQSAFFTSSQSNAGSPKSPCLKLTDSLCSCADFSHLSSSVVTSRDELSTDVINYDGDVDSDSDDVITLCVSRVRRRYTARQRLSTFTDMVVISSDSNQSPAELPLSRDPSTKDGVSHVVTSGGSESDDSVQPAHDGAGCRYELAVATKQSPVLFSESST